MKASGWAADCEGGGVERKGAVGFRLKLEYAGKKKASTHPTYRRGKTSEKLRSLYYQDQRKRGPFFSV